MLYNSTQNAKEVVSAAQAIAQGISKDGGLFVPQEFPKYDENTFNARLLVPATPFFLRGIKPNFAPFVKGHSRPGPGGGGKRLAILGGMQ